MKNYLHSFLKEWNSSVLVALYKKKHNLPIFDPKREEDMLLTYEQKVDFEI
jgi:chorismate mutase